jgi:hypothetical protein
VSRLAKSEDGTNGEKDGTGWEVVHGYDYSNEAANRGGKGVGPEGASKCAGSKGGVYNQCINQCID